MNVKKYASVFGPLLIRDANVQDETTSLHFAGLINFTLTLQFDYETRKYRIIEQKIRISSVTCVNLHLSCTSLLQMQRRCRHLDFNLRNSETFLRLLAHTVVLCVILTSVQIQMSVQTNNFQL